MYKSSEVESELLSGILNACLLHGVDDQSNCEITCQMMIAFSKADNFEITAMFLDDKDKERVQAIVDRVKGQVDEGKIGKIKAAY